MNTLQREIVIMLKIGRRFKGVLIVTGVTDLGPAPRVDVLVTAHTILAQSQISRGALLRGKIG